MEKQKKPIESKSAPAANKDAPGYSSVHESVNNSSTVVNKNEELLLRSKVLGLDSKGYTQQEIADELGISQPTVSRYLKEAREFAVEFRTEHSRRAIHDFQRQRIGQKRVLKGLWKIAEDPATSNSEKLRAYSLILQCNSRNNQFTLAAHDLSAWVEDELEAQRKREGIDLTAEEILSKELYGGTAVQHSKLDTATADQMRDLDC